MEILFHDLAGPLSNINGIASLLAEKLHGQGQSELDELVGVIRKTSERSIRLIREFVKQELLQSENSSLVKDRVDIVMLEQYKGSESDTSKTYHLNFSCEPLFVKLDICKFYSDNQ